MKLLFLPALALGASRSFVDDAGVTHTTDKAAPTIVAAAGDALSLFHMGTPHAQVVGTYGERCISGSNLNTYADWNANKEHFGDHNTAAHDPAFFPADPVSAEETAMLTSTPDLTPSCSQSCFWCSDTAGSHPGEPGEILRNLDANGWPDYILQGAYAGQWPLVADPNLLANATARGVEVISIIDVYNDADGSQSRPVSYIDVTETYERLATFLGATEDLSSEKREFCAEMNNFKATAAAAATRDIRAMGILAPNGPVTDGVASGAMYGANIDQVTMMLQELGMQIYERDATLGAWGASLDADALPYPVDFWLYDARITFDFTADAFAEQWPHPALVAKQYAYWPITGQMHSYQHAIDILRLVGEALGNANRIEDATDCTEVADVTAADYRVTGLAGGEYACPKPVDYDWCAVHATPSPVPAPTPAPTPTPAPDDDDKDDGPTENDVASAGGGAAAAGVVVGLAAGGVLGVLYAKKTNAAPMEQKAYDVSTDRV